MTIPSVCVFGQRALVALFATTLLFTATTAHAVTAPVAVDDNYSVDEDSTLVIDALLGVVANDTDDDLGPITAVLDTDVSSGTLSLSSDGSFTYEPDVNFEGSDSFTYYAHESVDGDSVAPATVTITVNAVNDAPDALDDTYSVDVNQTLNVNSANGVLDNDTDVEGDSLDAVDNSAGVTVEGGTYTLNTNGSFDYTPATDFTGTDSFTYKADDGTDESSVATVEITVNKLSQTITFGAIADQTYGDADVVVAPTSDSGLTVEISTSGDCSDDGLTTITLGDAGTCTVTASQAGNAIYDSAVDVDQTFTINPRAITVTAQTDTKVYDATTDSSVEPVITSGTLATGDTEGFSQSFDTADVGTGKTLTAVGAVNDGNGGNNYTVTFVADTTGVITKKALTITADDLTKVYGDANPTATASYDGFEGADDEGDLDTGVTLVIVANDQTDVNNHPITAFGASDSNYEITHVNGNLEITKRPITVTVNASGKVYDASDSASATLSPVGVLFTDVVTASQTTTTFANANVGVGKVVTASGITLGGADADNYSVPATATGSADITIRPVSVTADAQTKVYGASDPTLTYQITSGTLAGSDDFSGALTRVAGEDFGTYAISQGTLTLGGNYDLTYTGANLSITPATLTVTADDKTKVYGEANPSLTVSYSGFQNGDDAGDLDITPTAITSAVDDSDVGTYGITASGGTDANYTFSYVDGELEVTPLAITVTVDASDKVYDASDTASVVLTPIGVLFTDAVTAGYTIASFSDANVGTDKDVDVSGIILSGADENNYSIATTATGSADITKKMLTVTADDKQKAFGEVNPTLTVSYAGFEGGEDASVLNTVPNIETTALTGSNVGTYPITADDASDNNYDFSYVDGVLTVVKADQTITFSGLSDKNYGDADFTVSASADSGLDVAFSASGACTVSGDTVSLTTKGICTITASQSGDSNWNAAPDVDQSFEIFDVTAPIITLTGDASITHDLQSPYTDEGATALDDVDGVVIVSVTNLVDPGTVGTYYVTYNAVDAEGNVATTVTRTVEVVAATTNTGGGGGSGGTARRTTTPRSNGTVLGASTYNFSVDMTIGSTGQDVIELQKVLMGLGLLKIEAPTGYFGPLTQAAVKLYQASKGIITTGYVGPLTRGALNSGI